jgi:Predicted SPOUT methyltransferase.
MKIKIIAVGKIKEDYIQTGIRQYMKRLSPYCAVEILEVAEEKLRDVPGKGDVERTKEKEGERILAKLQRDDYVAALAIDGEQLTTVQLARRLERVSKENRSVVFLIGGSCGLSEKVLRNAHIRISFSKFTFPHQLMRLILLSQIYQALRHRDPETGR